MANQENGRIKHLKMRMPMELYRQLQIDADNHREKPSERARHILTDALMGIDISTPEEREKVRKMIEANWTKIRSAKKK